jgi:hypothetical protein
MKQALVAQARALDSDIEALLLALGEEAGAAARESELEGQ